MPKARKRRHRAGNRRLTRTFSTKENRQARHWDYKNRLYKQFLGGILYKYLRRCIDKLHPHCTILVRRNHLAICICPPYRFRANHTKPMYHPDTRGCHSHHTCCLHIRAQVPLGNSRDDNLYREDNPPNVHYHRNKLNYFYTFCRHMQWDQCVHMYHFYRHAYRGRRPDNIHSKAYSCHRHIFLYLRHISERILFSHNMCPGHIFAYLRHILANTHFYRNICPRTASRQSCTNLKKYRRFHYSIRKRLRICQS